MSVLIADSFPALLSEGLSQLNIAHRVQADLTAADLPQAISDARVLVVRSTEVRADTFKAAQNLGMVIRGGAGVNTIDLMAACQNGVHVTNTPGQNAAAVAELAWGHIFAADRQIVKTTNQLREGSWEKSKIKAAGLRGRTLGIVGLGEIGQKMIPVAKALGMDVLGWSRSLTPEKAALLGVQHCQSLGDLAALADVVSVHLASSSSTWGLISWDFFERLKAGAIFVNTSRGEVVDEEALLSSISKKGLRVGLDVFANEPKAGVAPFEKTILAEGLASATPHLGASTLQATEAVAKEVLRIIEAYLIRSVVMNSVLD